MVYTKTDNEIRILREGGSRLARIMDKLVRLVVPGASTSDLDDRAERLVRDGGDIPAFLGYKPAGSKRPYPASLCVSVDDAVVHGVPNEPGVVLVEGGIVTLDMGLTHGGLIVDMAVTVPVGSVDMGGQALIRVAREAREVAIKEARPGKTTGDIGAAVEAFVIKSGFRVAHELGGHGVGRAVHEDPFVPNIGPSGTGTVLEPGMVLALEPIVTEGKGDVYLDHLDGYTYRTLDGGRSAQFEHTVLITDEIAEILTVV